MVKEQLSNEMKKEMRSQIDDFKLSLIATEQDQRTNRSMRDNILEVLDIKHRQNSKKIEKLKSNIHVLQDQIRNGVEVKKDTMAEKEEKKEESETEEKAEDKEEEKKEEKKEEKAESEDEDSEDEE